MKHLSCIFICITLCVFLSACEISQNPNDSVLQTTQNSDINDNEFDGITFEMAYFRKITTKRDRLDTYYLFDEDEKMVYEVIYKKGPVPNKGTIEETTYQIGTFEGELGEDIILHLSDEIFYYTTRTGSMIKTDDQGEMVKLNHDQWDPRYENCEISDALAVLRKAELKE